MLSGLSRLLFVVEDDQRPPTPAAGNLGGGGGGASPRQSPRTPRGRMLEAAPPTYEEALSLFVRDGGAKGASGGLRALEGPKGVGAMRAIEGPPSNRRPSMSDDYELAERLQQDEIERASMSSASSAGDFRLLHRNPVYGQRSHHPVRGSRLRPIPESKLSGHYREWWS